MARFDNLHGSSWFNVKLGKFELDNLVSEKRSVTLSDDGGVYQIYHFVPPGDGNVFGQIGDNQLGLEVMGHSVNDRSRYSAALLSSNDGNVNLSAGANSYSGFFAASQAFDTGKLGVQRIGAYAMIGEAPPRGLLRRGRAERCLSPDPASVTSPLAAKVSSACSTSASTQTLQSSRNTAKTAPGLAKVMAILSTVSPAATIQQEPLFPPEHDRPSGTAFCLNLTTSTVRSLFL